jgi:hypothetical protein
MTTVDAGDLHELRAARMRDSLFQGLLSSEGLASFARQNGLGQFGNSDIHKLWSIGLLRADYVSSESPLERDGFTPVQASEYGATYLDTRVMELRAEGYGSSAAGTAPLDDGWSVFFHPFRLYVLYHVQRVFGPEMSATQFLSWQPGIRSVASWHEQSLVDFTSDPQFGARFNDWNVICEVAAVTEPMLNTRFVPSEKFRGELDSMATALSPWLRQIGQHGISEMREELGRAAHEMDSNKRVHVLMRLAHKQHRDQLKGRLGACMHFLKMAECIRRAAEVALARQLPEEDEIGWGTWMRGARRMLYGTERVFDARFGEVRDFLTLLGLDHGTRVRCYVEGETELGAMTRAVEDLGAIEFINLRGQFVQRGGKGLAFAESMEADYAAKVISIVLLDSDAGDNVRVLRTAIRSGKCFAPFFLSSPDFERANFTADELLALLEAFNDPTGQSQASSATSSPPKPAEAASRVSVPVTVQGPSEIRPLPRLPKSVAWGAALMTYALEHPDLPSNHWMQGRRPMMNAAELLVRACRAGFQLSVESLIVDESTGLLIEKRHISASA